jgi:hypothetical protein
MESISHGVLDPRMRGDDDFWGERTNEGPDAPPGKRCIRSGKPDRSARLTIFWHCGFPRFSFRTNAESAFRQRTVNGFGREFGLPKGLAMLIRSGKYGVQGGAANAARAQAIPAASLPTLLLGGLLLICP